MCDNRSTSLTLTTTYTKLCQLLWKGRTWRKLDCKCKVMYRAQEFLVLYSLTKQCLHISKNSYTKTVTTINIKQPFLLSAYYLICRRLYWFRWWHRCSFHWRYVTPWPYITLIRNFELHAWNSCSLLVEHFIALSLCWFTCFTNILFLSVINK